MGYIKRITAVFSAVLILIGLAGCGKGYKKEYIYFELNEKPLSLDAQTAYSDTELLIVRNIYEGLLREDFEGNIVCGAAESYTRQGNIFEFKLRRGAEWESGHKVTADDFLFGFQRAVDPKTQAPFAYRLFSVKNAKAIYEGQMGVESLGVKVLDDYTLTIELEREDSAFLKTLCDSVSMPCNREFFEGCIGKYGLDRECVNSNGSYALRKWNAEDFGIRLYKNEQYKGEFEAQNAAVFISLDDELTQTERLIDNGSDMAFLPTHEYTTAKQNGFKIESVENICWYLTFGDCYSETIKSALQSAFSQAVYSSSLPEGFSVADSIYPPFLNNDESFEFSEYNISVAQEKMRAAVQGFDGKVFPNATLHYAPSESIAGVATDIVGHWQKNLSAFINTKAAASNEELKSQITEKSLQFALFSIQARCSNAQEYLISLGMADKTVQEAQSSMQSDRNVLPVAYESTNIAYNPALQNVKMFDTNGYIDFSFIIKQK